MRFSVPHRQPGHPFVVRAEGYRVVVVGTRSGINVDGKADGKTDGKSAGQKAVGVDVDEGIVEVWETRPPSAAWRGSPPARAGRAPTSPRRRRRRGAAAVEPAPAPPSSPPPPSARDADAATGCGTRPASGGARAGAGLAGRDATERATSPAEIPERESPAARAALAAGTRRARCSFTARWRKGPALGRERLLRGREGPEREARPAGQRRRRLARATGPRTPTGSCASRPTCRSSRRWPAPATADEALSEANDFLRRRPDSERRAEIARLAGDLYRARGDCRRALGAYQITLGASRPRDAVEAATLPPAPPAWCSSATRAAPTPPAPTCAPTRAGSSGGEAATLAGGGGSRAAVRRAAVTRRISLGCALAGDPPWPPAGRPLVLDDLRWLPDAGR